MIRCQEGHFFDPQVHSSCPWCNKPLDFGGHATGPDMPAGKTTPLRDPGMQAQSKPAAGGTPAVTPGLSPGATRRMVHEELGMDPVVGWLVCVDGPDRGRDYRIHSEKNFIGRAPTMDICIAGDEAISREKHATLSFEPKKQIFWLLPGEAMGLVYLNNDVLYSPAQLKARDILELGKTKLMLVPFVDESFRWEK